MEEVIFLRQAALVAKLPLLEYLCYTRMVWRVWTSLIFPDPSAFFYSNGTVNKLLVYKDNKTLVLSWVFGNFNQCCLPSGTKHFHSNDIVFTGKKNTKRKKVHLVCSVIQYLKTLLSLVGINTLRICCEHEYLWETCISNSLVQVLLTFSVIHAGSSAAIKYRTNALYFPLPAGSPWWEGACGTNLQTLCCACCRSDSPHGQKRLLKAEDKEKRVVITIHWFRNVMPVAFQSLCDINTNQHILAARHVNNCSNSWVPPS